MMKSPLRAGLTVMASFVFTFATLSEEARGVLDANEHGRLVAQNYKHDVETWKQIIPQGARQNAKNEDNDH